MNKIIKGLAATFILVALSFVATNNDSKLVSVFELDAISAATDGSECTVQGWDCAKDWQAKGYVFDANKGFVKGAGTVTTTTPKATTAPVATTTTPKVTTKAGETTKATQATTTKAGETTAPVVTTAPDATTSGEATTAPVVTTVADTTAEDISSTTAAPAAENGELPIGLIGGGLALVAIVGFFIFNGMTKK